MSKAHCVWMGMSMVSLLELFYCCGYYGVKLKKYLK